MILSKRMTAKSREAKPATHANERTLKVIRLGQAELLVLKDFILPNAVVVGGQEVLPVADTLNEDKLSSQIREQAR